MVSIEKIMVWDVPSSFDQVFASPKPWTKMVAASVDGARGWPCSPILFVAHYGT